MIKPYRESLYTLVGIARDIGTLEETVMYRSMSF